MADGAASDQAWADLYVRPRDPDSIDWGWPPYRKPFADRLRTFDVSAVHLMPREWAEFLWHLSADVGDTVWRSSEPLELRLDILASVARLAKAIAPNTPADGFGLQWLWKEIIEHRERHQPEINDAIARHLADQLSEQDQRLQESALIGLLELDHPATPEAVRVAIPTLADDPEIRELATRLAKSRTL